jgi:hypothetical protein
MAKVNIEIEIDTEENTLDVSVNGTKMINPTHVSCYLYHDSYEKEDHVSCSISCSEEDEEAGVSKVTNYYTMSSKEALTVAQANRILDLPGFVGEKTTDVSSSISKFLTSSMRLS